MSFKHLHKCVHIVKSIIFITILSPSNKIAENRYFLSICKPKKDISLRTSRCGTSCAKRSSTVPTFIKTVWNYSNMVGRGSKVVMHGSAKPVYGGSIPPRASILIFSENQDHPRSETRGTAIISLTPGWRNWQTHRT